jgi:hypothetical protein
MGPGDVIPPAGMDIARLALLAGGFGVLACAHLVLLLGLCFRRPRWRALVALVVAPLAAYFGFTDGRRGWSALWLGGLVLYATGAWLVR